MAKLLLFNLQDPKKRQEILALSLRLNIRVIDVPPQRQSAAIRDLLAGTAQDGSVPAPFDREMLVMNGFERGDLNFFLNELRRTGCTVALKAVVTETNQYWSALQLYRALLAESAAMSGRPS